MKVKQRSWSGFCLQLIHIVQLRKWGDGTCTQSLLTDMTIGCITGTNTCTADSGNGMKDVNCIIQAWELSQFLRFCQLLVVNRPVKKKILRKPKIVERIGDFMWKTNLPGHLWCGDFSHFIDHLKQAQIYWIKTQWEVIIRNYPWTIDVRHWTGAREIWFYRSTLGLILVLITNLLVSKTTCMITVRYTRSASSVI